mmetsp:Transcript_80648/g.187233  ORF Transcript_80648/g.187233 Transcript_80648/m.187233 type:complete len:216 (+) Transcript_80648:35-682(+)
MCTDLAPHSTPLSEQQLLLTRQTPGLFWPATRVDARLAVAFVGCHQRKPQKDLACGNEVYFMEARRGPGPRFQLASSSTAPQRQAVLSIFVLEAVDLPSSKLDFGNICVAHHILVENGYDQALIIINWVEVQLHALFEDTVVACSVVHTSSHPDIVAQRDLAKDVIGGMDPGSRKPFHLPYEELDSLEAPHGPACGPIPKLAKYSTWVLHPQSLQ